MSYSIKKNINILVIGDLMLDHYIYGYCNRISPEAPVPVVEVKEDKYTLGGAGNVLQNLISLGCTANIISVVGDDENGKIIKKQVTSEGVNANRIINDQERCTTIKSRVLVANHQLIRLDKENTHPISDLVTDKIIKSLQKEVENYGIVLLSDYNKGLLTPTLLSGIFALCRKICLKTVVDPKGIDFSKYKGVNIIKPNKKEAILASGINIIDNDSLRASCVKIQEITNCDSVIITMSEDGIAFFNDNILKVIPTKALDVVDVTGAGDTVLAALGVSIASGRTLDQACDFANHAAAVVVKKVGSATATVKEIEQINDAV